MRSIQRRLSLGLISVMVIVGVVLARDLYPSRLDGDEPEPLELVPWQLNNLPELFAREDFNEGRALAALTLATEYLAGRFSGQTL